MVTRRGGPVGWSQKTLGEQGSNLGLKHDAMSASINSSVNGKATPVSRWSGPTLTPN